MRFPRLILLRAPEAEGSGGDQAAAQDQAKGLMDLAPAKDQPKAETGGHPAAGQDPAKAEDKKPPARPEDVPEQFWNAEKGELNVGALLKSHADLRRTISRGEHKPPATAAEYVIPAGDGVPKDLIKPDDPLWKTVTEAAHKRGLSQADLDAIAQPYLATLAEITKDIRPPDADTQKRALEAEMAKLGAQGPAIVTAVDTWLKGLAAKNVLNEGELGALRSMATAEGIQALVKLREIVGEKSLGIAAGAAPELGSQEEAQKLLVEGFTKGGEATEEGRALLEKGRAMLARLEKAGVRLSTSRPELRGTA